MPASRTRFLLASLLVAAFVTCTSTGCSPDEPRDVVASYLEAQIEGDGETAWRLLSAKTQERVPREQFVSDAPAARELREEYISRLKFDIVDQVIDGDHAEVVVKLRGPDVVEVVQGAEDPDTSEWFRIYHLVREPERGWRIELASTLPASVVTVSGIFLHRFFDVFERMTGVHERALDIFEKGLELGDRFLDIFEEELDRVHQNTNPQPRTQPTMPSLPSTKGDAAAPQPGPRPPTPQKTGGDDRNNGWKHKRTQDPMTDEIRHVYWTYGRDVDGASEHLRLDVWCSDGNARVFVHANSFHGFDSDGFDFGHASARIRLGDDDVREVRGALSQNNHSLELPGATQLTQEMLDSDADELRFEAPTPFDGRLIGRFALDGFSDVLGEHRSRCLRE